MGCSCEHCLYEEVAPSIHTYQGFLLRSLQRCMCPYCIAQSDRNVILKMFCFLIGERPQIRETKFVF